MFKGSGAFGEVCEGRIQRIQAYNHPMDKTKVAIKFLKSDDNDDFFKEALAASKLKHENVVEFFGVCLELDCIVTELMSGGQLLDYLHNNEDTLELNDLMKIALDICKGCAYLEKMKFVHRDIAARNCLLTSSDANLMKVRKSILMKELWGKIFFIIKI